MLWNKSGDNFLTAAKIFVIINVVFLVAVLCFVSLFIPKLAHHDRYARTCLTTSEGRIMCDRTEIQIYSYVKDVLENKYIEMKKMENKERAEYFKTMGTYPSSPIAMKPAAKLMGKRLPDRNVNKEMTPIDVWLDGRALEERGGFLRYGVRQYKGRLVVPVAGLYFVYAFVEFYEPCFYINGTPNVEDKISPIKHGIYKYSTADDKNTEIVLSAQPHKIAKDNDENVYSSHISTVLYLHAGDELSVLVSNVTLLAYTRYNYFGLRLI